MTLPNPPHRHVGECASTNDLARAWALDAADPAPHGAFVHAGFQTAGRGRRGRTWTAAPGENVLVSVILRPAFALSDAWSLAFAAGLAVRDVLLPVGLMPTLKWPNDVLLNGKKAAGILVETVLAPQGWAAIVGIGVNVNQSAFPDGALFQHPPTSLLLETGRTHRVAELTDALADTVTHRAAQDRQTILADWRAHMAGGITLRRGQETGTFVTVEDDGAARVLLPDNTCARWTSVDGHVPAHTPSAVFSEEEP